MQESAPFHEVPIVTVPLVAHIVSTSPAEIPAALLKRFPSLIGSLQIASEFLQPGDRRPNGFWCFKVKLRTRHTFIERLHLDFQRFDPLGQANQLALLVIGQTLCGGGREGFGDITSHWRG